MTSLIEAAVITTTGLGTFAIALVLELAIVRYFFFVTVRAIEKHRISASKGEIPDLFRRSGATSVKALNTAQRFTR